MASTKMDDDVIERQIYETFAEAYASQNDGAAAPAVDRQTVLLDSGLDSLGFAILVTQLEEKLGYDPFSLSTESFFPQTFDDFITFYQKNKPA